MSWKSIFYLIFFLSIFLISSCSSPPEETFFKKEEKERFEDFFKKFLFLEGAVYTLYGSKPMTEIVLTPGTPEEKLTLQQAALKKLSKKELTEFKSSSFEYEEKYWFEETWKIWEEKLKVLPLKRFLFVERKIGIPANFQKNRYIYFINIGETAHILKKHYSLFKNYVGFDFDPLSVIFEVYNPDSPFWNAIWGEKITGQNVCLTGLLFGYGLKNSYFFSWHFIAAKTAAENAFRESFLKSGRPTVTDKALKTFNPPDKFFLPAYISYSISDEQIEQYKNEYEKIRDIYGRSNIIDCTMQQLLN
jgi:hypothetical protein